ncbi:MAG: Hsp33 family molecular chaperone HslO [Hyphomicrobiales bacterium]|nr:Hsp33 family molecular chaperone HslO [Hyphomicrobiales bacterium]
MSTTTDLIQPFQIEGLNIRGRLVRLGATLARGLRGHDYPPPVAGMVGEGMALAAVLAGGLKYDGIFSFQIQGDGPLGLLVTDVTSGGDLRGYARFDAAAVAAAGDDGGTVPRLFGAGHMAFTVDQGPNTERYQGVTELSGASLGDCAHNYFRQSEQLDTALTLAARTGDAPSSAGLMLQRLPGAGMGDLDAEERDEQWRRAVILMASVTADELLDPGLDPNRLLFNLFNEDGVRVFEPRPLRFRCRCSRHRVVNTLRSFPAREVREMAEDGRITVTCEFCKADYLFDVDEFAA